MMTFEDYLFDPYQYQLNDIVSGKFEHQEVQFQDFRSSKAQIESLRNCYRRILHKVILGQSFDSVWQISSENNGGF